MVRREVAQPLRPAAPRTKPTRQPPRRVPNRRRIDLEIQRREIVREIVADTEFSVEERRHLGAHLPYKEGDPSPPCAPSARKTTPVRHVVTCVLPPHARLTWPNGGALATWRGVMPETAVR